MLTIRGPVLLPNLGSRIYAYEDRCAHEMFGWLDKQNLVCQSG